MNLCLDFALEWPWGQCMRGDLPVDCPSIRGRRLVSSR